MNLFRHIENRYTSIFYLYPKLSAKWTADYSYIINLHEMICVQCTLQNKNIPNYVDEQ